MGKLEKLQCTSCGGRIDRLTLTCQMCGMQYRLDEEDRPIRLEVSHLNFVNLGTSMRVPAYALKSENTEDIMKYTLTELAHNMAEKILPLMEFQTEFDIAHQDYVTYARLRVAEPNSHYTVHNYFSDDKRFI